MLAYSYASVIYILLICNFLQTASKPASQPPCGYGVDEGEGSAETTTLLRLIETFLYRKVANLYEKFTQFDGYAAHDGRPGGNDGFDLDLLEVSLQKLKEPLLLIEDLADFLDRKLQTALIHINETLINNSEAFDDFARRLKHTLRHAPQAYGNDSCRQFDVLVEHSFAQLRDCCSISIRPMLSLCQTARQLVTKGMSVFVDALDHVQACLEDKNSYADYLLPCLSVVHDDVADLIRRAVELHDKVNIVFPECFLKSRRCLAVALVEEKHSKWD